MTDITPEQMIEWLDDLLKPPFIDDKEQKMLAAIREFIKQHSAKPVKEGENKNCECLRWEGHDQGYICMDCGQIYPRELCNLRNHAGVGSVVGAYRLGLRTPTSAPKDIEGDYKKVLAALNDRRNSVTNVPSHRDYWDRIIEALDRIAARDVA